MNSHSNWMKCTTCKSIVVLNATGICLGCQTGFTKPLDEERYGLKPTLDPVPEPITAKYEYMPIETINQKEKKNG